MRTIEDKLREELNEEITKIWNREMEQEIEENERRLELLSMTMPDTGDIDGHQS